MSLLPREKMLDTFEQSRLPAQDSFANADVVRKTFPVVRRMLLAYLLSLEPIQAILA